ncbi:hypothetical protein Tco_0660349 [Tanacetum coccineum]
MVVAFGAACEGLGPGSDVGAWLRSRKEGLGERGEFRIEARWKKREIRIKMKIGYRRKREEEKESRRGGCDLEGWFTVGRGNGSGGGGGGVRGVWKKRRAGGLSAGRLEHGAGYMVL